jgi:Ser/Thr protein kinase RdoA (MazF antagonist)
MMAVAQAAPSGSTVAPWCERHYGVTGVRTEGELAGGMFARPVLLASDRGPLVLRRHVFRRNEPAFRFQSDAMNAVAHAGLAARVLDTLDGDSCVAAPDGVGVMALHEFVAGTQFDWVEWRRLSDNAPGFLERLGGSVAALHNALAAAAPRGDARLSPDLPPIQFAHLRLTREAWEQSLDAICAELAPACEASVEALLASRRLLERAWDWLVQTALEVGIDAIPPQVIHGDVSPVNLVWGAEARVRFIDWDACHVGHRMYDALGDVLHRAPESRPEWNGLRRDHLRRYLAGYAAALDVPLIPVELDAIPVFTLARQLEDLRQRVAVLPALDPAQDGRYATLIGLRCELINQTLATTPDLWRQSHPTS